MTVEAILKHKGHEVVTADCELPLQEIARLLCDKRIGAIVLLDDNGGIAGIISERDIARAMAEAGAEAAAHPARDFMTKDVRTCSLSDTSAKLMGIMTDRRVRHLPVVEEGKMIGIVSIGDVVKQRIDEIAFEAEQMKQYIVS